MSITTALQKQGFSEKKSKVYLALLALGRTTTLAIARRTGLKRTSVYDIMNDLVAAGYASEITVGKKRYFVPEHPKQVLTRMEERIGDTRALVGQLLFLYQQTSTRPEVHFYEGPLGLKTIMEDILTIQEKEHRYWGSVGDLIDHFGIDYVRKWLKRRIKRGFWSLGLLTPKRRLPHDLSASDPKFLRKVKWLPKEVVFSGCLGLYDDKVGYISSPEESFGFIIKSKELSTLLRQIFDTMWLMAETKV